MNTSCEKTLSDSENSFPNCDGKNTLLSNIPSGNFPSKNLIPSYPPSLPSSFPIPPPFSYPPPNFFPSVDHLPPIYNYNAFPLSHPVTNQTSTIQNYNFENKPLQMVKDKLFPGLIKKRNPLAEVKLWKVSHDLQKFYKLLRNLEIEYKRLETTNFASLSEWKMNCQNINTKKDQLELLKNSMRFDSKFLRLLKFKINQRRKKRKYRKKMRKSRSSIFVNETAKIHMETLQSEANQVKQEEKLKQEADNILSSVMQKKSDVRYHIQLLNNLLKLHSARVHQLTVETKLTVDESITGFQKILEKLRTLWEVKLHEYTIEENGLKLMIKELAINAEDEDCLKLNNTFEKWLKFLFGINDLKSNLFYSNYEQLTVIRNEWDKYVVNGEDQSGSKIPGGWVIPKYSNDEGWKKFLCS